MTGARLVVLARTTPELVERVCRLLRHRGATVEHLVVATGRPSHDAVEQTRLELLVRATGSVDLLVRQLQRLPDVQLVAHAPLSETTVAQ
jgi:acetolactate synthase regulatory subunit